MNIKLMLYGAIALYVLTFLCFLGAIWIDGLAAELGSTAVLTLITAVAFNAIYDDQRSKSRRARTTSYD